MITIGNYIMILRSGYLQVPVSITRALIVPIGCINTFIGFTSSAKSTTVKNPRDSIAATVLTNNVSDSANMPTRMDNIDAAFSSPIDANFVTKLVVGGNHNDQSIFPTLNYKLEGESDDSISHGMDTPAVVLITRPMDTATETATVTAVAATTYTATPATAMAT
jgi:hypothetical protein